MTKQELRDLVKANGFHQTFMHYFGAVDDPVLNRLAIQYKQSAFDIHSILEVPDIVKLHPVEEKVLGMVKKKFPEYDIEITYGTRGLDGCFRKQMFINKQKVDVSWSEALINDFAMLKDVDPAKELYACLVYEIKRVMDIKEFRYPYPAIAKLKSKPIDTVRDGGTKVFEVINKEEIGLEKIWQDKRIGSTSKGEFFSAYPDDGVPIAGAFVQFEN